MIEAAEESKGFSSQQSRRGKKKGGNDGGRQNEYKVKNAASRSDL